MGLGPFGIAIINYDDPKNPSTIARLNTGLLGYIWKISLTNNEKVWIDYLI